MKFPKHLRRDIPTGKVLKTDNILKDLNINTVCSQALCPNQFECFSRKCATFLACGNVCTRSCAFCNIKHSKSPPPLDESEIYNIALAAKKLDLKHIVITMVTRDDLEDKGAIHLSKIILETKKQNPNSTIEVLTSDFSNSYDLIEIILDCKVDIFNYNIETVKRLSTKIR
ncbi:MAG: radical SAM protein, partial [Parachlamydiales bacterium]